MSWRRLLRYDIERGLGRSWLFLFVPLCVGTVCLSFRQSILFWRSYAFPDASPSWALFAARLFTGLGETGRESGSQLPVIWMLGLLLPLLITLRYPFRDIKTVGVQLLLRCSSRVGWWLAKCAWSVLSTAAYFLLVYTTVGVFCAVFGIPLTLEMSGSSLLILFADAGASPDVTAAAPEQVASAVLLLPFLAAAALNMLELLLSLVIRPVFSFLVCVALVTASAYAKTPLLFPNYANIARSRAFYVGGLDGGTGAAICLAVLVLSAVCGAALFRRRDILPDYKEI